MLLAATDKIQGLIGEYSHLSQSEVNYQIIVTIIPMSAKHGIIAGGEKPIFMRILVVSDIHANLAAFEAVLKAAKGEWDQIWCLGDLVGYGPNPNECVALLREHDHVSLSGNHDWATLRKIGTEDFSDDARDIVFWTRSVLDEEARNYLQTLPALSVINQFTLAHASPRHPVWEYVYDYKTADANFAHFDTPYCLIGHTHVPLLISKDESGELTLFLPDDADQFLLENTRCMINPGSVGQPRDGDPRAAFAFLDLAGSTWEFHRVAYPIKETQRQMRLQNFPRPLIERLSFGW